MKTSRWVVVIVATLCWLSVTLTTKGEEPARLSAFANNALPDEPLFLLRYLEVLYEQLPDPRQFKNFKECESAVVERKRLTERIRVHIARSGLDSKLIPLFGDYDKVMDAMVSFHSMSGKMSRESTVKALAEAGINALKYAAPAVAATSALQNAKEGEFLSNTKLIVGLASAVVGFGTEINQQYEANKRTVEAETRERLEAATSICQSALAHAQEVAKMLTIERGWKNGEAGWVVDQGFLSRYQSLVKSGDRPGLIKLAEESVAIRPRDPFVRQFRIQLLESDDTLVRSFGAKEYLVLADDYFECAALVPPPALYDDIRGELLVRGALSAFRSRGLETSHGISQFGSTRASQTALSMIELCLKIAPKSDAGFLKFLRCCALLADAQVREAYEQALEIAGLFLEDSEFQYLRACILSRLGDGSAALDALKRCFGLGFSDIYRVKKDPDFTSLRSESEFQELMKVQYVCRVQYGLLFDDIVLQNKSAFPITNVKITPTLEQDGKRWNPDLRIVASLPPGQTHKWRNVVSIPGQRLTSFKATIECDQNK